MLSFVLGLLVGAVLGAKHQAMTLYFYERVKPVISTWKTAIIKMFGNWFSKK